MSQTDTAHSWWSRLRHQGLLLSPVVMVERYPTAPQIPPFPALLRLREARTRFEAKIEGKKEDQERDQAAILGFVDSLIENFLGHAGNHYAKQGQFSDKYTVPIRVGSRTDTVRPHRIIFADDSGNTPALLVMADPSPHVGRGRGRTKYAQMLELLRGTGHRLGLLTNGQQFRLIYAGLDFESWCEWESDRWFDDGEGTEELCGIHQLLSPNSIKPVNSGVSGLLDAVEESRKRQADLSSVLRENVRQAVELLLEEVSTANRSNPNLFNELKSHDGDRQLSDSESHEALLQATVRIVMRLVVCLFAESRQLLPINDPIFAQSYGIRTLYELLDEVTRYEGGTHALFGWHTAWPRLMALFRLIHGGSAHGAFPLRPYGGVLFRPGDASSSDPVARALHILEHKIKVGDVTIYYVLRKLLRGPLPVIKGKSKTYVEGPVNYTDLRTEFIGLIYEGLLDYRLKRTDEQFGPQVFLNIGREPVLPLKRLEAMLDDDKKALKDLLTKLRKEKVTAPVADDDESEEEEAEEVEEQAEEDVHEGITVDSDVDKNERGDDYLDAFESAKRWAMEAVVLSGLVRRQSKKESDSQYQQEIEAEANRLIKKVVATGEFYLVRAGNTRKGTGTFYTRPQLAVPTVHRTLEPLCYDKDNKGLLVPKSPEIILGLKVCDPACGSASFLVASLHYLTEALYRSLLLHQHLGDPEKAKHLTLPYGRPRTNGESDQLVPFSPNDTQRGYTFEDRIKALLRRHIVERCIYGVDINPLAIEFARVSLWVETLDPELPFSFLDHKIKVGNSLVGCWLDRVEDYPLKAWEREGGDGKDGPRTQRIEEFLKGEKVGSRRTGDGRIKKEMRQVIESRFSSQAHLFANEKTTAESVVSEARKDYERLHQLPIGDPDQREVYYRDHVERSQPIRVLKMAMDEWCAVWYWRTDESSMQHVPTPISFHHASERKYALIEQLAHDIKFFHWEIEYPDVFTTERSGFDAVLGNPPWEVMKPISQEFFTEYDPLYRTYDKQLALRHQEELFASVDGIKQLWDEYNGVFKSWSNWVANAGEPFVLSLTRKKNKDKELASQWSKIRSSRQGFSAQQKPFAFQGSADLNSYKLFLEVAHHLLRPHGRFGFIVPSGMYTDAGCHDLRELFINHSTWEWIFGFINWELIFNIYYRFKFAVTIVQRSPPTTGHVIRSCFGRYMLRDWETADSIVFPLPKSVIMEFSPKSLSILEINCQQDLDICRKVYANSYRIGDSNSTWSVSYAREFDMTNDSKHFPPLAKWKDKGYQPDVFGQWLSADGSKALPLYEGRMIGQYDFSQKGWVSGKGRTAKWREIPDDSKQIEPQYLISASTYKSWPKAVLGPKVAFMDIASSTNARTTIAAVHCGLPFGHSAPVLSFSGQSLERPLVLSALMNSLTFDFVARQRIGGLHLTWFLVEECPLPKRLLERHDDSISRLLRMNTARLTFLHRRFAPEWLRMRKIIPELSQVEWKKWWAVTESERLMLRLQNDALCSKSFGLNEEDFAWILRDDQTDPKGFWRVDKQLPKNERYISLAIAAFRSLEEDLWSAEYAASISSDEFFDILGIPELTSVAAAKSKGLSGPLIERRKGCNIWKPEDLSPDDPRYGWTWDHCWQDAVALLGSEDAVREYIEGNSDDIEEKAGYTDGGELLGDPVIEKPKQSELF